MRLGLRSTAALALLTGLAVLGGCTQDAGPRSLPVVPERVTARMVSLTRTDDCDQLVEVTRERMRAELEQRSTWNEGFGSSGSEDSGTVSADRALASASPDAPVTTTAGAPTATAGSSAEAAQDPAAGDVVAGTNNQEAAVDEADLVKTDGRRIVTVVGGVLRVVVLDDAPAVDGTLDLGAEYGGQLSGDQLFLRRDEAVVLGDAPTQNGSAAQIIRVDLTDPAAPRLIERTAVDGQVAAARMIDDRIRLVLRSSPVAVADAMSLRTEAAEVATDRLTATDLLPRRIDPSGATRSLGSCGDVLSVPVSAQPSDGSATTDIASTSVTPSQVTVLSIGADLSDLAPVTVSGDVEVVYAGSTALYVTSSLWSGTGSTTVVHRFDLSGSGPANYTGSGFTPGRLLNQYSLSDRGGDLRLVTTTDPTTMPAVEDMAMDDAVPSAGSGRLAVLRPDDAGTLVEVGHLDDLGVGEQVKSVRFLDDRAYVVTFRQTDPLFAIDLADATAPRLLGELKIPGFSEYLHPVGDGLLLGIGADADASNGRVTGFKASLFDVRDPSAPKELNSFVVPDARSTVGADPHTFTWDPVHGQAVVPIERGGFGGSSCPPDVMCATVGIAEPGGTDGASVPGSASLVIGVDGDRLTVRGTLVHEQGGLTSPILRSVVVDDDLWTVSSMGLGRTSATSPTSVALLPF